MRENPMNRTINCHRSSTVSAAHHQNYPQMSFELSSQKPLQALCSSLKICGEAGSYQCNWGTFGEISLCRNRLVRDFMLLAQRW